MSRTLSRPQTAAAARARPGGSRVQSAVGAGNGSLVDPIVSRPDGYYWLSDDGRIEVGPFDTAEAAWANLHAADEGAPEPGETVEEAEAEIGVADWTDPETGQPAEGHAPRFSE